MEKGMMETKLDERIGWAIEIVRKHAKKEEIVFDKDLFLEACKLGETLLVRSEIQYSGKKS